MRVCYRPAGEERKCDEGLRAPSSTFSGTQHPENGTQVPERRSRRGGRAVGQVDMPPYYTPGYTLPPCTPLYTLPPGYTMPPCLPGTRLVVPAPRAQARWRACDGRLAQE